MNLVNGAGLPGPLLVKKQEDTEDRGGGKDTKPVKTTLNRVPRSSLPILAVALTDPTHSRCLREFPILFSIALTLSLP
jgi:hypothetical protein